jgi:hypothetical protein
MTGGTLTGPTLLRDHMMWVSDCKFCVVSDELMTKKWLWVGSHLPKTELPTDVDISKTDAGAGPPHAHVPKGRAHEVMNHDMVLTAAQFDAILKKAIDTYESETHHLEREEHKVKLKPTEDPSPPRGPSPMPLARTDTPPSPASPGKMISRRTHS